jgi:hypothetical protein
VCGNCESGGVEAELDHSPASELEVPGGRREKRCFHTSRYQVLASASARSVEHAAIGRNEDVGAIPRLVAI